MTNSMTNCISENHEGIKRCYIMTIGCLDKYRRLGVGTTLLNYILETAKADGCVKATLHVQVSFIVTLLYEYWVIYSNSQSQWMIRSISDIIYIFRLQINWRLSFMRKMDLPFRIRLADIIKILNQLMHMFLKKV